MQLIPWARPLCAWILHRSELKVENATAKAVEMNKKSACFGPLSTLSQHSVDKDNTWGQVGGWMGWKQQPCFSHSRVVVMTVVKQRGERRACAHFCGRMEVHPCFLKCQWEESAARLQQLVVICCRRVFGSEEHHSTALISPKKSVWIVQ